MNQDANTVETVFLTALEKSTPEEQAAYVESACTGIPGLLDRVQELLSSHHQSHGPLDSPPPVSISRAPVIQDQIGAVIGPYKLLEQIGEGGMGVVYMAEQFHPMKRKVALKIIKPGMDTKQVVARFEAERQTLALMDHPNIAKVLDGGSTDTAGASAHESNSATPCELPTTDRPYFVMELVRGIPITDYCDENKLTTNERLELFVKVCRAVQHAHQKGIIHRDMKPTNVLITLHDGVPVPKVIDFGVAKAINQELTERTLFTNFAQMVGTPLYMSPEQAELSCLDVDTRSDIYSLGVLLYELMTGSTPFDKETLKRAGFDEMRRMIREDEPPRPSVRVSTLQAAALSVVSQQRGSDPRKLVRTLRGELDWIVMRAMEKDRNRRYESASALTDDVRKYLENLPIQASPPSNSYLLRKFVRRHRTILSTAALVLAIVMAGAAISVWQAWEARIARRDAEHNLQVAKKQEIEADKQRRSADRLAMNLALDRGIMLCQQGNLAQGMLWLARALEVSQYTDSVTEPAVRANLGYWGRRLLPLETVLQVADAATLRSGAIDGRNSRVATAGGATARVWDLATGQVVGQPFQALGEARAVSFVGPDGARLLVGDSEGKVTLWDYLAGKSTALALSHTKRITTVSASPDGTLALVCDYQGRSQLWDLASGDPVGASVPIGIGQRAYFSPDGKTVLFCHDDAIHYADVTGSPLMWQVLKTDGSQVLAAAISPDGRWLFHGSASQAILRGTTDNGVVGVPMQH